MSMFKTIISLRYFKISKWSQKNINEETQNTYKTKFQIYTLPRTVFHLIHACLMFLKIYHNLWIVLNLLFNPNKETKSWRTNLKGMRRISLKLLVVGELHIAWFKAHLSRIGLIVADHIYCSRLILKLQECLHNTLTLNTLVIPE